MSIAMEIQHSEFSDNGRADWARLIEDSKNWSSLATRTLLEVIRNSAARGGIYYDDVILQSQASLSTSFTHLDHTWDFFDEILNNLSISRKIDSGHSNRLFVQGEQPWLARTTEFGGVAVRAAGW